MQAKSGKLLVRYVLFILERGNKSGHVAFRGRSSLQMFHVQPVSAPMLHALILYEYIHTNKDIYIYTYI